MRSGLLRAVVAVTAGLALTLGAAPPPAQAADVDDYADVTLDVLGALLVAKTYLLDSPFPRWRSSRTS